MTVIKQKFAPLIEVFGTDNVVVTYQERGTLQIHTIENTSLPDLYKATAQYLPKESIPALIEELKKHLPK